MSKPLQKRALSCLGWLMVILLFNFSNQYGNAFNLAYQNHWYPWISKYLRRISHLFSFSVGDVFYLILVIFLGYWLIRFFIYLFQKKWQKSLWFGLIVIRTFCIIYALFLIFWAGNYQRVSFAEKIQLKNDSLNAERLDQITQLLIQKANESYPTWRKSNQQYQIDTSVKLAYAYYQKNTLTSFPILSFKNSLFSSGMSKLGIMGYYQPFWGEGTINTQIPKVDIPFIICHEMAHQKGIAYEDEAHLMAVWLIKNYGNEVFKFSMYINMLDYVLPANSSYNSEKYKENLQKLKPEIVTLLKARRAYWQKQTGFMQDVSSFLFDQLLKANDQDKGIQSYLGINKWLYNLYLNAEH